MGNDQSPRTTGFPTKVPAGPLVLRDRMIARQSMPDDGLLTVDRLLAAIRRQILPLGLCAAVGLFVGLFHYATSPKQYYTEAQVLVDDRMSVLAEEIDASVSFVRTDTSFHNEIQILKSLHHAKVVAERLNLMERASFHSTPTSLIRQYVDRARGAVRGLLPSGSDEPVVTGPPPSPEAQRAAELQRTASKLRGAIRIDRMGQSYSINIGYVGPDAALAAEIVNAYALAYLDDPLRARMDALERTGDWLSERLDQLDAASADIEGQIAAYKSQSVSADDAGLRVLVQRYRAIESIRESLIENYEEVSIENTVPVMGARVLTEAVVPSNPALPKATSTVGIFLVLGLIGGFLVAVYRETRERGVRSSRDVILETGAEFLGYVPEFPARHARPIRWLTDLLGGGAKQQHRNLEFCVRNPGSVASETLKNVASTFQLESGTGLRGTVAVSSILPGEGASTVAANYANLVAESAQPTLLVDLDIRGQMLSRHLSGPGAPGLLDVLEGRATIEEAILRNPRTHLNFLPAGRSMRGGYDGLTLPDQRGAIDLLSKLRAEFNHIVLDTPPLAAVSDAKGLLPVIDRVLLVARWGATPKNLMHDYFWREPMLRRVLLGTILTRTKLGQLRTYDPLSGADSFERDHVYMR